MIDLEKFEKEEFQIIKKIHSQLRYYDLYDLFIDAFSQAMVALKEERERCAKIAEDVGYSEGLERIDDQFLGLLRDLKDHIAEEIRREK